MRDAEDFVTDHALVRWLERVGGIDMAYFRREIAERCKDLLDSGASGGWVDDHWCVIRDGNVVTFRPAKADTYNHDERKLGRRK